jgi:hypothetical protein
MDKEMDLEANPEETEVTVEWQELFKKEVNFENFGSLEDRYQERCLVVLHCRGQRRGPETVLGPDRNLFATWKQLIHRSVPVVCKERVRKGSGKVKAAKKAPNSRMLVKSQQSTVVEDGRAMQRNSHTRGCGR